MVASATVRGTFRVIRVRHQDPRSKAAILVAERIDEFENRERRQVLQLPGHLAHVATYVAQTFRVAGKATRWCNPHTGKWEEQISVIELEEVRPNGEIWIDVVANNPAFVGVGRKLAAKLWQALGCDVMRHLDSGDVNVIMDAVPELGETRVQTMIEAWRACGHEELVRWLEQRQLPRRVAHKLISAYGGQSRIIELLERDPFRLMAFGIDFEVVDEIAQRSFEVESHDPRRLHAAVVHCVNRAYSLGHTAVDHATLIRALNRLAGFAPDTSEQALSGLYHDGGFVRPFPKIYQLRGAFLMEREIAHDLLRRRVGTAQHRLDFDRAAAIKKIEQQEGGFKLSDQQRKAVLTAADEPVSLILGGAGTGKTACLRALHNIVEAETGRRDAILQMAVAGKAAKRLKEATGRDAVTIAGFLHVVDEDRIAKATHTIIDEASMLDVPSFNHILRRLRGRTQLVLVGDPSQLPPIGAGKVLDVLAERPDLPITTLGQVFRQGDRSSIRTVASAVRDGRLIDIDPFDGRAEGVSIHESDDDARAAVIDVVRALSIKGGLDDFCALTSTRHGPDKSSMAINRSLQRFLNPGGASIMMGGTDTGFAVGDRLVCDENFWSLGLMNGSTGTILRVLSDDEAGAVSSHRIGDPKSDGWGRPIVEIEADQESIVLHEYHLRRCSWGYALTCHRAQGSDFDTAIICLDDKIDRSWLYTAITRARRQAILIGSIAMLEKAILRPPRVDSRVIALPEHFAHVAARNGSLHA